MPVTRILVDRNGRIVIEGIGYQGDECLTDLRIIAEALARLGVKLDVETHQRKQEAYTALEDTEKSEA